MAVWGRSKDEGKNGTRNGLNQLKEFVRENGHYKHYSNKCPTQI
jgi:hypothetical protein